MEKLLASMAKKFVIIGDESKYVQKLDPKFPLVLEVLPEAVAFIRKVIYSLLPICRFSLRRTQETADKPVLTRHGNYLVDCYFQEWPDLEMIQIQSRKITGIIEISLFYQMVNEAIIAGKTGITRYVA
jgi:ribose 5-phosphate isomerase A